MKSPEPGFVLGTGAPPAGGPALFLDRDGVINRDLGYVHTPAKTVWVPGIFRFCRAIRAAGLPIVVVTNQSGIARGYYSDSDFRTFTQWLHEQFSQRSVDILSTWYCPHLPTQTCACRKPQPGLLLAAAAMHGIDLAASVLVGDRPSDLQAAEQAGVGRAFLFGPSGFAPIAAAMGLDDHELLSDAPAQTEL